MNNQCIREESHATNTVFSFLVQPGWKEWGLLAVVCVMWSKSQDTMTLCVRLMLVCGMLVCEV